MGRARLADVSASCRLSESFRHGDVAYVVLGLHRRGRGVCRIRAWNGPNRLESLALRTREDIPAPYEQAILLRIISMTACG